MTAYYDFIKTVLAGAAQIASDKFGKVTGITKDGDNNQILTEADLAIGKYIIQKIQEQYPDHNIIDEETDAIDKNSKYTWVIDPIDGTSNFAAGVPEYGIMMGLLRESTPIAGGIALPYFSNTTIALKDKGSFTNDKKIQVTNEKKLLETLIAYLIDGHREDPSFTREEGKLLSEIILNIRNLRSSNSCYDAVLVAQGHYGGVLNRTSKIWDNVALQIVIEEAGGVYTDFFGKSIDYSDPLTRVENNFTFCAAAPVLHKQLQEIIHNK